jgi:flagella basal body P-ring formation protein FlgA
VSVNNLSEAVLNRGGQRCKKLLNPAHEADKNRKQGVRRGLMAAGLLLISASCAADPLTDQLTAFMQKQYTPAPVALEVTIKTPVNQRLVCDQPQFSLPSRNRIWGNISIAMVCGAQKRYLQTDVKVTGRYLVAARLINASQTLTNDDIAWQTGRLDLLYQMPLNDMSLAVGCVSERTIGSGQPLTAAMLRRAWLVKMGQQVQVSVQGEGFAIQSTGKAMSNASLNDALQVRMDAGQIVNGKLMANGSVHVNL